MESTRVLRVLRVSQSASDFESSSVSLYSFICKNTKIANAINRYINHLPL